MLIFITLFLQILNDFNFGQFGQFGQNTNFFELSLIELLLELNLFNFFKHCHQIVY